MEAVLWFVFEDSEKCQVRIHVSASQEALKQKQVSPSEISVTFDDNIKIVLWQK